MKQLEEKEKNWQKIEEDMNKNKVAAKSKIVLDIGIYLFFVFSPYNVQFNFKTLI